MENCPVCGKHISPAKRCDLCGFDDSCNYEAYMTLGSVPAGIRSLSGMRIDYMKSLNKDGQTGVDKDKTQPERKWFGHPSKIIAVAACLGIVLAAVALGGKLMAPSTPGEPNGSFVLPGSYSENIPTEDDVTKADGSDVRQQENNPQGASSLPDVSDDAGSKGNAVPDAPQKDQARSQTPDSPPVVQNNPQDVQDIPQTDNTKPSQKDLQAQADAHEKKLEWENAAEQYRLMRSYGYLNDSALSNKLLNLGESAWKNHREHYEGQYDANAVAAFELFQESYSLGNMQAAYSIGMCYYDKIGVERDYSTAVQYFAEAANAGVPDGMHHLGFLGYMEGHGIEKNVELGVYWLTKSFNAGNIYSAYTLGINLQNEGYEEEGFEWYLKGAQSGNVWCMENLANCYRYGWGVEKNAEQEIYWLEKFLKECSPAPWNKDDIQKRLEKLYEEQNS